MAGARAPGSERGNTKNRREKMSITFGKSGGWIMKSKRGAGSGEGGANVKNECVVVRYIFGFWFGIVARTKTRNVRAHCAFSGRVACDVRCCQKETCAGMCRCELGRRGVGR